MKKFLGIASMALLMGSVSAHAATWTWAVSASFFSYSVYGDTYDINGLPQPQPTAEYLVTDQVGSPVPDGGTLSGSITFNETGTPISWNLTTTMTTLPGSDPAFSNIPAYTAFPGNFYSNATSDTGKGLFDNGASGDVYFLDNTSGYALDFSLPLLWGNAFNTPGTVVGGGSQPMQEAIAQCSSDNFPGVPDPSLCDYIGTFRVDGREEAGNIVSSLSFRLTDVSGLQQTNTPEPATLAILGTGLVALGLRRRRVATKA